jgi:chromosome partitioning protein
MQPHVLVLAAAKGGVGKTTSALAIAGALHEAGRRVLVVDLDPQGGATYAAGLDPNDLPAGKGLVEVLEQRRSADEAAITSSEGFGVLAASAGLERLAGRVGPLLTRLRSASVDVLVLDTPPGVGEFVQAGVRVADVVVVCLQLEPASVHTYSRTKALLAAVEARERLRGVIACMVQPRTLLAGAQRDELAKVATILGEVPRSIVVAEAVAAGMSVIGYAPHSPAAEAYRAIAVALEL